MISQSLQSEARNGKVENGAPVLTKYDQHLRVLELTVQLLIARTDMRDYWPQGFKDLQVLLAAFPLPATAFKTANRHLQNADSYCQQDEFGAATFELRVLRGQLQQL